MTSPKGPVIFSALWSSLALALLVTLIAGGLLYFRFPANPNSYQAGVPSEFSVILDAREQVASGANPYLERAPFRYSPGFLALLRLLPTPEQVSVTYGDAWFYFLMFNLAVLSSVLWMGARYRNLKDVGYLLGGLGLAWKGILDVLENGQLEILILGFLTLAAAAFSQVTFLSGVLVGFVGWLKLPWALMLVPFLLAASRKHSGDPRPPARRLKLFFSGYILSSFSVGVVIPSLVYGPERAAELTQGWFDVLKFHPPAEFLTPLNQSLWASGVRLFSEWGGLSVMPALGLACVLVAVFLGLLLNRYPISPSAKEPLAWLTPWLLLGALIQPYSFRWNSLYLLGAFFAASRVQPGPRSSEPVRFLTRFRPAIWVLLLLLTLLQMNPVVQALGLGHWSELHQHGVTTASWIVALALSL